MPVETRTRWRLRIGGNEIGERLAGAGSGLGEQRAAVLERVGDGRGHVHLAGARLEVGEGARQRAVRGKRADGAFREG